MGFDYDLLKAFAGQLGVELEVIIKHSPSEMFEALDAGEGDVIAASPSPKYVQAHARIPLTTPAW